MTLVRRHVANALSADHVVQEMMAALEETLPEFRHNRRSGAFRSWLKTVTIFRIRCHWDLEARRVEALAHLKDPSSGPSKLWNAEHSCHVLNLMFTIVRPEFEATAWQAFTRCVIEEQPATMIATGLGLPVNAVYIAKARVFQRLRQEGIAFDKHLPNWNYRVVPSRYEIEKLSRPVPKLIAFILPHICFIK